MIGSARFDPTEAYRYELRREWGSAHPFPRKGDPTPVIDKPDRAVAFLMLNPSTADAMKLDPTVRRCCGFAADWGYGALEVINLFALRSTDPKALRRTLKAGGDPVGPENDETILRVAASVDMVVCAWGNHGALLKRGEAVRAMLVGKVPLRALEISKDGHPVHPLYQPADAVLLHL